MFEVKINFNKPDKFGLLKDEIDTVKSIIVKQKCGWKFEYQIEDITSIEIKQVDDDKN